MKVSIWQQFSSNHSATFRIIGKFTSRADAKEAASVLNQLFYDIAAWYEAHEFTGEPSPPEQAIADLYDMEWHDPVDYLTDVSKNDAKDTVKIFRDVLELGGYTGTRMHKHTLEELVQRLGAETAGWEMEVITLLDESTIFSTHIEAIARDAESIQTIIADWTRQFSDMKADYIKYDGLLFELNYPCFDLGYFKYMFKSLAKLQFINISYQLKKKNFD